MLRTPPDNHIKILATLKVQVQQYLSEFIGVYNRADGSVTPAIHISPPDVPLTYRATGIECVINEPENDIHNLMGRRIYNEKNLVVVFVNHDKTKGLRDLNHAVITFLIPLYIRGELVYQPANGQLLEQTTVRLFSPELIQL